MEVHVPLVAGVHEETDAKLLPQGRLLRAENVRFEKEGRIVQRNGYEITDRAEADEVNELDVVSSAQYEAKRTLHFVQRDAYNAGGVWFQRDPSGGYTSHVASCITTIESPRRIVAAPSIRYGAIASDMTMVTDLDTATSYYFVVYNDYDSVDNSDGGLFWAAYETRTMRLAASGTIVDYGSDASGYFNPKCIALNQEALVFYATETAILMWKFDPTTLTGADVAMSPAFTVLDPIAGHHPSFDVCAATDNPFSASDVILCAEGILSAASIAVTANRVAADGTRTTLYTFGTAFGLEPKQIGVALVANTSTTWAVGVVTEGEIRYGRFNSSGAAVGSVTDLDTSGDVVGAPCMATSSDHAFVIAWAVSGSPSGKMGAWGFDAWGGGDPPEYLPSLFPVSKPFVTNEGGVVVWCVDETHNPVDGQAGDYGTYRLVDISSMHGRSVNAGETVSEVVCAQEQALAGNWYLGEAWEQRRSVVVSTHKDSFGQNYNNHAGALPTLIGAATTAGKVDFVLFRSGAFVDRLVPAKINGQLFLSGARVCEFDGSQLYESGLFQGPKEFTVVQGADDGDLTQGDYRYCAIWKWIDAAGRVHRSQVSAPVTYGAPGEPPFSADITIAQPPFSDRQAHGTVTIFAEVYRTTNNGTVFYLLNPNKRIIITPDLSVPLTFTDTQADEDIEDNETIYIGDGTILDNGEPPPCKYIWAGEDRLICGGLEDPTMYAFSKRVKPGDGLAFPLTDETAFRGTIEGEITGVAQLDGTWFIGSRDAIWSVSGEGPNDEGQGTFTRPRKLPSDTGFLNQRSICEVPQGLLFQGRSNKMYLLPRGGGAPVWVGKTIQDILTEFPYISCCRALPEEHIAVFHLWKFAVDDEEADGRVLVFDTEVGEWSVDEPFLTEDPATRRFKSVAVWGGKLLFDGIIEETDEWTDDHDGASPNWITVNVETGDMRFFGAAGHGRCRRVHVLGESLVDNVNMSLEVSRDSGATWDTPPATWNAANAFADDRQYDLPYVRGGNFRFRLSATTSDDGGVPTPGRGVALNALSFEVYPEQGLKRLASSKRT